MLRRLLLQAPTSCRRLSNAYRYSAPSHSPRFFSSSSSSQSPNSSFIEHLQDKCNLGRIKSGDAGYRSPYLSHAKRALYHLSYIPILLFDFTLMNVYAGNTRSVALASCSRFSTTTAFDLLAFHTIARFFSSSSSQIPNSHFVEH
uniref:Uncharacterized protein n=1 Tax=Quercus lobata TaxID=97700 RepID=A0A7N2L007_QUELO